MPYNMSAERTTQHDHHFLNLLKKYFDIESQDEKSTKRSDQEIPGEEEDDLEGFIVNDSDVETVDKEEEEEEDDNNIYDKDGSIDGNSPPHQIECGCSHNLDSPQYDSPEHE